MTTSGSNSPRSSNRRAAEILARAGWFARSTSSAARQSRQGGEVGRDQRFLFLSAPTFQLSFALNGCFLRIDSFGVYEADWTSSRRIRRCLPSVVGLETFGHIIGVTDVEGVVGAAKYVDARHDEGAWPRAVGRRLDHAVRIPKEDAPRGRPHWWSNRVDRICRGAPRLAALARDTTRLGRFEWPATSEEAKRPSRVVRKGRFELPRSCERQPLKLVRLPVPPLPREA